MSSKNKLYRKGIIDGIIGTLQPLPEPKDGIIWSNCFSWIPHEEGFVERQYAVFCTKIDSDGDRTNRNEICVFSHGDFMADDGRTLLDISYYDEVVWAAIT